MRYLAFLLACPALAQFLIPQGSAVESRAVEAFNQIAADRSAPVLGCTITSYPPRLGFSFRYWAGFDLNFPIRQFSRESQASVALILRITPDASPDHPYFFQAQFPLPVFPKDLQIPKNQEYATGGGFTVGEGKYEAALQIVDSAGRVCRKSWKFEARSAKVPLRISPGVVEESQTNRWRGMPPKQGNETLTVLVHAAPLFRRRHMVRLSSWDLTVLLGSLTTIIDQSKFSSVRVVAFNFDAGKVILDEERFDRGSYNRLFRALRSLNLGMVDIKTLERNSPVALLESIARRELDRSPPSNTVLLLGPPSRYDSKLPPVLKELRSQFARVFGIELQPSPGTPDDLLHRFVTTPRGKVAIVYQPADLAKAIRDLDDRP